jgi:hypothetical protein
MINKVKFNFIFMFIGERLRETEPPSFFKRSPKKRPKKGSCCSAAAATLEGLKKKNKELDNNKHQENVTKQIRT